MRDKLVGARGECGVRAPEPLEEIGDSPFLFSRTLFLFRSFFLLAAVLLTDLSREDIAVERIAVERKVESRVKVDC